MELTKNRENGANCYGLGNPRGHDRFWPLAATKTKEEVQSGDPESETN